MYRQKMNMSVGSSSDEYLDWMPEPGHTELEKLVRDLVVGDSDRVECMNVSILYRQGVQKR